jgi:hypothetical protein
VKSREERLARNEAMFREINERLESKIVVSSGGNDQLSVLCECANPDCTDRIALTVDEYETVRSNPRQFVVAPGHAYLEVEDVVSRNDRYEIVRKTGVAGDFAARFDPSQ